MRKIALILLVGFYITTHAQITSTFDTDADGWTFYHGPTGTFSSVNHSASGGNPNGHISVTYSSQINTSAVQYWIAPAKYLGSKVAQCLDMNLKLDLQQSVAGTNSSTRGDIRIKNGSSILVLTFSSKPAVAPAWSSYSIPLNETGGWQWGSLGPVATRDQIKSVLSNITAIEINGTYAANASYLSGLDNVVLEERALPPAPAVGFLSATSGKPGQSITINGTGFNPAASNNIVRFGAVAGTVTAASATQLTVTIPVGAQYEKLSITNTTTGLTGTSRQPFNPLFDGGGRIIRDSFKPRVDITPTTNVEGFSVTDIDGDGWADMAIASSTTYKTISIYRNLGNGGEITAASFAPVVPVTIPGTSTNYTGIQFVDLDGDGKLDLITSNVLVTFGSAYFITYRNISTPGNIAFEAPETWLGLTDDSSPSLITDLDGDGRPELVGGEGSYSTGALFWITQNISTPGNIEFGGAVGYFINASNGGFGGASAGDLNGDGKNELMVAHGDRYSIFKNNSTPGSISLTSIGMITSGQYITSLQTIDLNRDGKNDLIWKNNGVTIYTRLNTNTGAPLALTDFTTEFTFAGDLQAYGGLSIADINGDGKPDIAASEDGDLGVYENTFSGGTFDANSFVPAYQLQGYAGGIYPTTPVAADLNGDSKPELIVATTNITIRISIFENKNVHAPVISVNTVSPLKGAIGSTVTITGNNFSTTITDNVVKIGGVDATVLTATETQLTASVPAGTTYGSVSVTKSDLTSRYRLPFVTTFSSGVTFNNTHFAPPVNFTLTNANYDIEVGDLNRDGKPDILAEANGGFVFRNTHVSGAITTSSLLADDTLSVNSFINPRLEDFDGDGFLDVASVNGLAHKNNSTPTKISHLPAVTLGLGGSTMDMSDFNNDGKLDIAVTVDLSGTGDLLIRENRSTTSSTNFTTGTYGSFSGNIIFNKPAAGGGVVSEDFDGDGFSDIATTNPSTDNISVYLNAGLLKISGAQFASRLDLAVGDSPGRIYKGDFDADGKTDMILYHGGTSTTLLTVFHNTSTVGSLSFTRIDLTNPSTTTVATIADLDGDGKPEIITTSETGNRFTIFKNVHAAGALTAASFAAPFNTTVTAPRGIATGDLNLDGKPEIILTRAAGLLVVYENLITTLQPPTITSFSPASGPVGTTVIITGTNFSTTPSDNIVTFNGTTATVTASTATTITISVPAGATTGPISVSVAGNTSTSSSDFTVIPAGIVITTQPSSLSVCANATITFTTAATGTTNIAYQWQFSPDGVAPFANITNGGAYTNATTASLSVNTTGNFGAGRYRCYISGDAATPITTNEAELIIIPTPPAPVTTGGSRCGTGAVTLNAQGAAAGQYRWYTIASGGTAIPGETNATYATPALSVTTTYYASIVAGTCESQRMPVVATIFPIPSLSVTGASACPGSIVTLIAEGGSNGQYKWYTDAIAAPPIPEQVNSSFTTPALTETTTYFVTVTVNGCESTRTPVTATIVTVGCGPQIEAASLSTVIGGTIVIDLIPLIVANGDLDFNSIRVLTMPSSGARTTIENGILTINYAGINFSGIETISLEACNTNGFCGEQIFTIEVNGDVVIYNAVSPNEDGKNEIFFLQFIDALPSTRTNSVHIYNRWGDEVFSVADYDNKTRVFSGKNKDGNKLPSGTYFYKINFPMQNKTLTGFLSVKH